MGPFKKYIKFIFVKAKSIKVAQESLRFGKGCLGLREPKARQSTSALHILTAVSVLKGHAPCQEVTELRRGETDPF